MSLTTANRRPLRRGSSLGSATLTDSITGSPRAVLIPVPTVVSAPTPAATAAVRAMKSLRPIRLGPAFEPPSGRISRAAGTGCSTDVGRSTGAGAGYPLTGGYRLADGHVLPGYLLIGRYGLISGHVLPGCLLISGYRLNGGHMLIRRYGLTGGHVLPRCLLISGYRLTGGHMLIRRYGLTGEHGPIGEGCGPGRATGLDRRWDPATGPALDRSQSQQGHRPGNLQDQQEDEQVEHHREPEEPRPGQEVAPPAAGADEGHRGQHSETGQDPRQHPANPPGRRGRTDQPTPQVVVDQRDHPEDQRHEAHHRNVPTPRVRRPYPARCEERAGRRMRSLKASGPQGPNTLGPCDLGASRLRTLRPRDLRA